MSRDNFGDRINLPIIFRFDHFFIAVMQNTMLDLCKEIQSARLGYIQSDEITIICIPRNYTKNEAFYNNSVICFSKQSN